MVRVYLREHHISELDEIQILSVVDELATNAVKHAYSYNEGEIKVVLNFMTVKLRNRYLFSAGILFRGVILSALSKLFQSIRF